jgi:hypothetical protein
MILHCDTSWFGLTFNEHVLMYCDMTGTVHEDEEGGERKGILLPQFEIVIEPEEELLDDLKTEEERVQEFERMVQEGKAGTLQGLLVIFCWKCVIVTCTR